MSMEVSCGIIPIKCPKDSRPSVFIVKHKYGSHWGFPKGHAQIGETHLQTACRELFEETGLSISKLLSTKSLVQKYSYYKNTIAYSKKVFYFMAIVKGKICLQEEEIAEGKWVSFLEAISLFSFESNKDIASKALTFLEEKLY